MLPDNMSLEFAAADERHHVFMVIDGQIIQWDPTVPLPLPTANKNVIQFALGNRMDDNA
ncbi:MAG: hypothetical protein ACRCZF_09840 [Gemmataceae bacterium]